MAHRATAGDVVAGVFGGPCTGTRGCQAVLDPQGVSSPVSKPPPEKTNAHMAHRSLA